ncbi:MAG: nucleotidyltransferase domain-containing protein [Candidatus Omnitrophica bacterium]|nr:nucleotidyltransferase domain-containing protein [Candidatus Omnitrophota bacterium]
MLEGPIDKQSVDLLMAELKAGLRSIYGDRLRGVYLYGSYARGEADAESDMDVLVVLSGYDHYWDEIQRTSHLSASLSLKYSVSISKVYLRERDWLERESSFLSNVREEAIAA